MTRIRSKILGENAIVNEDLSVVFDSGVQYSKEEIAVLEHSSQEDIAVIHYVKDIFGGDIEYYGFQADVKECRMPMLKRESKILQYTIGGSLVEQGYTWNKETYAKFKQIITDLQSSKWLDRKRGDEQWFEFRRNFFLHTWNEMIVVLNKFRKEHGVCPIESIILLINEEFKNMKFQIDRDPCLCPIMDEVWALDNLNVDPEIKIENKEPENNGQYSLF